MQQVRRGGLGRGGRPPLSAQKAEGRASYPVPRIASTSASTLDCAGSCSTPILPVLKRTSAVLTPGRSRSAFSIFGTPAGHENSSLRSTALVIYRKGRV